MVAHTFWVMCAPPVESDRDSCICTCAFSTREGRSCVVCYAAEPSRQARASRGCVMSLRCSRTHDPRVECRVLAARAACSERITNTIVARARAELGSILDSGYDLRCYEHVVAVFFRLVYRWRALNRSSKIYVGLTHHPTALPVRTLHGDRSQHLNPHRIPYHNLLLRHS